MLTLHLYIFHEVSFMSFPIGLSFCDDYSMNSGYKSFNGYMCCDFCCLLVDNGLSIHLLGYFDEQEFSF